MHWLSELYADFVLLWCRFLKPLVDLHLQTTWQDGVEVNLLDVVAFFALTENQHVVDLVAHPADETHPVQALNVIVWLSQQINHLEGLDVDHFEVIVNNRQEEATAIRCFGLCELLLCWCRTFAFLS